MLSFYRYDDRRVSDGNDKKRVDTDMISIAILTCPSAQEAAVLGMTDLFVAADRGRAEEPNQAAMPVLSVDRWSVTNGTMLPADANEPVATVPSVCILPPTLGGPRDDIDPILIRWLRDRHTAGTVLASVCLGAFVLGETGLLDGRTITTHWAYEDRFRSRFPRTSVDTDRIVIDDGDIVTAGGVMAWTDLCLTIIARFLGQGAMMEVARAFLIDPPGRAQSYYSGFSPHTGHRDDAILKTQRFIHDTDGKVVDVATLATLAGLEERTFLRRFQKATGHTTTEYWQRLRVSNAKTMLRDTGIAIDQIGWDVGYTDPGAFRKVFHRIVGLPPSDYRRRYSASGLLPHGVDPL